jgi:hypothetical protein
MGKSKNALVWLGGGVFTREGKSYTHGDVLPVDDIDSKELASLKKKGLVGNPVKAVDASQDNRLIEAQAKAIKELEAALAECKMELKGAMELLGEKDNIIADLEKKLKDES